MNEAETRAELIDPALREAGWGVVADSRVRRETICPGRIEGAGRRGKQEIADYALTFRNHKLAVIEAKAEGQGETEGVAQAKAYAQKLQAHFAYSTNGRRIYCIDMKTGREGYVDHWPTPDELWAAVFATPNDWRDRFAAVPFKTSGKWSTRYYQHNAIENGLEAIATGKPRILLTLATGTGKTAIAFQIAWTLFQSRWNLSREPNRRPRILFLADRNTLANQAYNSFSAFPEDALARIKPDEIRKKGRVPKNASIFFTIFQTFMSGKTVDGEDAPYFGDYPQDFFDFIIIDECHRGGANDESSWRGILEYFAPAVQLGLTATPKRKDNVDTYAYFGEPVYIYSLKDGINDGFLTPFKVKQIATTLDDYVYTPDDRLIDGEIVEGRRYTEAQFNRTIEIEERERYRVELFMGEIDQHEKTLVFCATQGHAALVRDLINQMKASKDPNYCVRVTADDGARGDEFLETFQDNEKTIPTILTTSQKLSTGIDARNVRNIVLMRQIGTMIEFKQIIGRGTRLFDGKDYFTIYDFVKAYEHFNDPEWDGEPLEPAVQPLKQEKPEGWDEDGVLYEPPAPADGPKTIRIKLADGKERAIQSMMATSYWAPDGKPMSANQMIEKLFGELPRYFKDESQLRAVWSEPETRKSLLEALREGGFGPEQLAEIARMIAAEKSDVFDVLAYIAFAVPPISREERVNERRSAIIDGQDAKLVAFLDFVMGQYVRDGVGELDREKLAPLLTLKYQSVNDAIALLGPAGQINDAFLGAQKALFS
ncbi:MULTISPECIES: EcoAI/FtnUII family type I restriction enzme subunit R [unclassified Mesorhizobium]|uniref:EcoAI/FtnUII family type I restriction enzme subunit R n=1 Tax=unclassified Mesorhizobium TaxID=325217 RepID=UPI001CCFE650|nr:MULTISPECIES: type I restriction endonuclease subunit R [unclassified Mesorhizobium]MBZ9738230.1 DEAD/DEAH box helicase family protein [Mesorhizobium sp. CO1-1-4]MBZ9803462.1 DEAD/DEAH box helicase family protein [Mesorhizobium sp. ES1-6]